MATYAWKRDDPLSAVWRVIRARLEAFPDLDVKGLTLLFYDGATDSLRDLDSFEGAAVRFRPAVGRVEWFDAAHTGEALVVGVRADLPGADSEDLFGLHGAVSRAVSGYAEPGFQADLVDAGAATGVVLFTQPLADGQAAPEQDNVLRLTGGFAVEVLRDQTV